MFNEISLEQILSYCSWTCCFSEGKEGSSCAVEGFSGERGPILVFLNGFFNLDGDKAVFEVGCFGWETVLKF